MSKNEVVNKKVNNVFLQEVVLRKRHDGVWIADRLVTNKGTFELLPQVQQEFDSELVLKFVEYVKSHCWGDIVEATTSGV